MPFSPKTKYDAFCRAYGRCECNRKNCGHIGRCKNVCRVPNDDLFRARYNGDYSVIKYPGFEFHHITAIQSGGDDSLSNCEFLCEDCHKNTGSYGSHD